MKAFNVIYKDGRFYETTTDKHLMLSPDTEAILIVDKDRDVKLIDKSAEKFLPLNATSKLAQVQRDSFKFKKILNAGDKLYFYMPINKVKYLAYAELLEDLYLYNGHHTNSSDVALYPCICNCVKIEGKEMKEPITAPSVSDLFKRVYVHQNGNQGNPARNAFKVFLTDLRNSNSTLDNVRSKTAF